MSYGGRIRCWSPHRNAFVAASNVNGSPSADATNYNQPPKRAPLSNVTGESSRWKKGSSEEPRSMDSSLLGFSSWKRRKGGLKEFQSGSNSSTKSKDESNRRSSRTLSGDYTDRDEKGLLQDPPDHDSGCDVNRTNYSHICDQDHNLQHTHRSNNSREASPCLKRINRYHSGGSNINATNSTSIQQQPLLSRNTKVMGLPPLPNSKSPHRPSNYKSSSSERSIRNDGALKTFPNNNHHHSGAKNNSSNLNSSADNSPSSYEQLKNKLKEVSDKCFNSGKMAPSRLLSRFCKNDSAPNHTNTNNKHNSSSSGGIDSPSVNGRKVRSFSFGGLSHVKELSSAVERTQSYHEDLDDGNEDDEDFELRVNPLYVEDDEILMLKDSSSTTTLTPTPDTMVRNSYRGNHSNHRHGNTSSSNTSGFLSLPGVPPKTHKSSSSAASYRSHGSGGSNNSDGDSGIVNENAECSSLFQESLGLHNSSPTSGNGCCSVRFAEDLHGGEDHVRNNDKSCWETCSLASNPRNDTRWIRDSTGRRRMRRPSSSSNYSESRANDPSFAIMDDDLNFDEERVGRRSRNPRLMSKSSSNVSALGHQNLPNNDPSSAVIGEYKLVRVRRINWSDQNDDSGWNRLVSRNDLGITIHKNTDEASAGGYVINDIHKDSAIAR